MQAAQNSIVSLGDSRLADLVVKVNAQFSKIVEHEFAESFDWGTQPGREYRRIVLSRTATEFGPMETVLLDFPDFQSTVPHIHPICGAETVISGQLLEHQFRSLEGGKYLYESSRELLTGCQISHFEWSGHPHSLLALGGSARVVATFCGFGTVQVIDKVDLLNLDEIPAPFPYHEWVHG